MANCLMGRRVFVSFLGTSAYKECIYKSESLGESSVVTYVQDAILELVGKDWNKDDRAFIFLTEEAKKKHWESLAVQLSKYSFSVVSIEDMPEGYTEDGIWEVFLKVYSVFEKGDEVILDITHAFRSLPMMAMVLLQYAKLLKKIKVIGVYYGAFEVLGPAYDIENKFPDPSDRKASLLDLSAFSELQDWASATDNFLEFGNSKKLSAKLDYSNFNQPNFTENQNKKNKAHLLTFSRGLRQLSDAISTNRGEEIVKGTYAVDLLNDIGKVREVARGVSKLSPLIEILDVLSSRIGEFKRDQVWNGIVAVEWCLNSNLVQQGITLLQEFIITIVLDRIGADYQNKTTRDVVSAYFGKKTIDDFLYSTESDKRLFEESLILPIQALPYSKDLGTIFHDLAANHRNDINHAGFGRLAKNSSEFRKCLERNIAKLKAINF